MTTFVDGPTRRPLRYGLLSVADIFEDPSAAWRITDGGQWQSLPCEPAGGLAIDCDTQDGPALTTGRGLMSEASAFVVYGEAVCSPIGFTVTDAANAAEAHLIAREEARVEQAIWTGDLGNTPSFRTATDLTDAGPVGIILAIAELDQELAQSYGSQGVLHMTRAAAVAGVASGALISSGGLLTTGTGTPVAAGAGYDGSSPAAVAGTMAAQWIYATPRPVVHRSGVAVTGGMLDTGNNDMAAAAERAYLVGWDDCGTYAIETDLTG